MSRPRRSRLDDRLGERRHVAEAEIEALAGDRMDAVRGVAGEREARRDEGARQRQAERKGARLVDDAISPSSMAEAPLELGLRRTAVVADTSRSASAVALRPHDRRAVARLSGRIANGPAGQEVLLGAAVMRPLMRDGATMPDWP